MIKKIGSWGGSRSIRLEIECKELNIKQGEEVKVYTQENEIIIEKIDKSFKTNDNVLFAIKE